MTAPTTVRRTLPALLLAFACAGGANAGGLDLHAGADPEDIGLPVYPGAVENPDKTDSKAGFSFGLWGSEFGFHVYLMKYRSADGVDAVAAFYRDALARYGTVVDCSVPRAADPASTAKDKRSEKEKSQAPVTCGDDHAAAGGRLYKVGIESAYRMVTIKPAATGVTFETTREEAHGMD